jgi:hypothetical protein
MAPSEPFTTQRENLAQPEASEAGANAGPEWPAAERSKDHRNPGGEALAGEPLFAVCEAAQHSGRAQ